MILLYHQEVLILMYKLVQLIHTITVHRCLDKTMSLISVYVKYVFFCDQTHGRANKLPIKINNFFSLSNIMV